MDVLLKNGDCKMQEDYNKQLLKTIGIIREITQNNMQCVLENYSEILSKLDLLIYLILKNC